MGQKFQKMKNSFRQYLLQYCIIVSLFLSLKPSEARAEFSTAILAVGIVIGITVAEISNYYDKKAENSQQDKATANN
jgi:hypothetical protein